MARFLAFVLIVAGGFAALRWTPLASYLDQHTLLALLERLQSVWWAPAVLLGLYLVLCPLGFPATPLIVAGGLVFGPYWGTFYNYVGTELGAVASFLLARSFGRELVAHLPSKRLKRFEKQLHRHGFWYLVATRFMPIPFPIANFGPALAGFGTLSFAGASALGLAPVVFLYTYFSAALLGTAAGERSGLVRSFLLFILLFLALSLAPALIARLRRRRRLAALRAQRAGRGAASAREARGPE